MARIEAHFEPRENRVDYTRALRRNLELGGQSEEIMSLNNYTDPDPAHRLNPKAAASDRRR